MRLKIASSSGVLSFSGWGASGSAMGSRDRASPRYRTVERGCSCLHIFLFFSLLFLKTRRIGTNGEKLSRIIRACTEQSHILLYLYI